MTDALRPTPLEVASGVVYGRQPGAAALEPDGSGRASSEAFEVALLEALAHPPCRVSFSGGRDSSAVLASATATARRHGLPDPVPVTLRFPDVPAAGEDEWQEQVVRHVGVTEWARLDLTDEIDVVGRHATESMRRHGLLWPFNAHFHVPILRHGSGGSLLTGVGGDELLLPSRWSRVAQVLTARVRPGARDLPRAAVALAPRPVRARVLGRRGVAPLPWLRPAAQARLERARALDAAGDPVSWARWVREVWWPSRYRRVAVHSLELLGADAGVAVHHPFTHPAVLDALARERGVVGFVDRAQAMEHLFGGLLPEPVLTRRSKASFDGAFWNRCADAFVASWDGSGVDDELVDAEALQAMWARGDRDPRTYLLLQCAWAAQQLGARRSGA